MKRTRNIAISILVLIFAVSLAANFFARAPYALQFRDFINAPASRQFWLGTDELGRDRWSRLLYGSRISLLLAPAAAMLSTAMAILIGGVAGYVGGWWDRVVLRVIDIFLSIPWLFLFLIVRALLPLNTAPLVSVIITFLIMGLLGWAPAARVIRAGAQSLRDSDLVLHARRCRLPRPAAGSRPDCPEPEAGDLRPVLDLDPHIHPWRSQLGADRPGRRRAAALVGKFAARAR